MEKIFAPLEIEPKPSALKAKHLSSKAVTSKPSSSEVQLFYHHEQKTKFGKCQGTWRMWLYNDTKARQKLLGICFANKKANRACTDKLYRIKNCVPGILNVIIYCCRDNAINTYRNLLAMTIRIPIYVHLQNQNCPFPTFLLTPGRNLHNLKWSIFKTKAILYLDTKKLLLRVFLLISPLLRKLVEFKTTLVSRE